jgi:hypothetical protein
LRELSLHILDLIENSVRAGATLVAVTVEEEPEWDMLRIEVEDNGPGLPVPAETATDPFYTTKEGKRLGLGLALFRFRIEQSGGELALSRSLLGGTAVRAALRLSHVDRSPLGDLAATLSSSLAANPQLDLHVRLKAGSRERVLSSRDIARELVEVGSPGSGNRRAETANPPKPNRLAVARRIHEMITESLSALQFKE